MPCWMADACKLQNRKQSQKSQSQSQLYKCQMCQANSPNYILLFVIIVCERLCDGNINDSECQLARTILLEAVN